MKSSTGGLDRLEMDDRPDPGEPGPGDVRLASHAFRFEMSGGHFGKIGMEW